MKRCQSIPNSHFIYQFLEPLSSPQASFSLTLLPSATWICLPGTLHCYSNGWAFFPIKSPAFFAFTPLQAQALQCFLQNLFTQHKLSIPLDSTVLPSHHCTSKLFNNALSGALCVSGKLSTTSLVPYLNILCAKLQSLLKTSLHQVLQIAAESLVMVLMANPPKIAIYVTCCSKINSALVLPASHSKWQALLLAASM